MIDIKIFNVTRILTNCYLLTDKDTGEMAVVDPGGKSDDLISVINQKGKKLKYVIITHGHYDHIGYAKQLADMFDAKIVCGKRTQDFISDNSLNLSMFHDDIENITPFNADVLLSDGDEFELGNTKFTYISTPGHTIDCGCYIFDNYIICGDTLFCESYGRTDLPTGSVSEMMNSIKRLKALNGDYNVLPGHGKMSTLNHERKYNPMMSML